MPTLEAKWESDCAACGMAILLGERIDYTTAKGARHLACIDMPANVRRNLYRMTCRVCGSKLRKGEGALIVTEVDVGKDGSPMHIRRYQAECVDVSACARRVGQ
jgi:hypothetical protein